MKLVQVDDYFLNPAAIAYIDEVDDSINLIRDDEENDDDVDEFIFFDIHFIGGKSLGIYTIYSPDDRKEMRQSIINTRNKLIKDIQNESCISLT